MISNASPTSDASFLCVSVTVGSEISISSSETMIFAGNFTEENSLHKNPSYYPRNCNFEEPIITEIALNHGICGELSGGAITGAFSRAFNEELHPTRWMKGRFSDPQKLKNVTVFQLDPWDSKDGSLHPKYIDAYMTNKLGEVGKNMGGTYGVGCDCRAYVRDVVNSLELHLVKRK
jgi:hypothetical protein